MKLGVFLPNWVGDAVMATPALRAVRMQFADAEIVGIVRPVIADVLAGLTLVDRVLVHDPRGRNPNGRGWPFVAELRRERFDLLLLLPNSLRTAILARLSGAKRRVGFARDGRRWLLTDALAPRSKAVPHPLLDEYLRLARHLGCPRSSRQMELAVLPADRRQLDAFWSTQPAGLRERGVICLNPGGAFGSAKHWPAASFAELGRRIARELQKTVLVLCGPAEREQAREIVRLAADRHVVGLADVELGIGLTKAAVQQAELLVTTDSGPRHFAPPFDVPVVTLFGPTHVAWSETYFEKARHVQLALECGPCQQRTCPLRHHRCMRDLTAAAVFAAVVEHFDRFGTCRAA